jgi:hypothetical protein
MHARHDIAAVGHDPFAARRAECHVKDGSILGRVDVLAREHRVDPPAEPSSAGERDQQAQRVVRETVLRVVEEDAGPLRGETLAPPRIGAEDLPEGDLMHVPEVVGERPPLREPGETDRRLGIHLASLLCCPWKLSWRANGPRLRPHLSRGLSDPAGNDCCRALVLPESRRPPLAGRPPVLPDFPRPGDRDRRDTSTPRQSRTLTVALPAGGRRCSSHHQVGRPKGENGCACLPVPRVRCYIRDDRPGRPGARPAAQPGGREERDCDPERFAREGR